SCTCPIGRDDDPKAVLDTNFRVRGTTGRRVVDASVFPKIPGFFIVTSVYMIGEKAAEVISADAAKSPRDAAPISQAPAARRGASRSRPCDIQPCTDYIWRVTRRARTARAAAVPDNPSISPNRRDRA